MLLMKSIPFTFHDKLYYALVRFNNKKESIELRVTIMNGDLEKILYGHNIFEYRNGYLVVDCPEQPPLLAELKLSVLHGLDEYFQQHPLNIDHSIKNI